jgi:hypothetical protein
VFAVGQDLLLYNAINFAGTVTGAEFVTGTGTALSGPAVFKGDLLTSDGVAGSAGVLAPTFRFVSRGRPVDVSTILLRPFPDLESLSLQGDGMGTFRSPDGLVIHSHFTVALQERNSGGSFPGTLEVIIPGQNQGISFQLLATTSGNQKFVMIGQGGTGQLTAQGVVTPATTLAPTSVNALYNLIPLEGRPGFGAINFTVGSVLNP